MQIKPELIGKEEASNYYAPNTSFLPSFLNLVLCMNMHWKTLVDGWLVHQLLLHLLNEESLTAFGRKGLGLWDIKNSQKVKKQKIAIH
jgi:hypothetical protein